MKVVHFMMVAEVVGFEPTIPFLKCLISSQVPSTAWLHFLILVAEVGIEPTTSWL